MKKLSKIYEALFIKNNLLVLQQLIEREISVGGELVSKLTSINSDLSKKMLTFLNSDKIKDKINVDYVTYDSDNEALLTLGFKDREGNDRTKLMKVTKLMTYLGASMDDVKGYELEELIGHLQKGNLDNFKIVKGDDILKAYHCGNYEEDKDGETITSCMSSPSAQSYLKIYTDNPNQVNCLVLFNPETKKVRGRALIWNMDDGTKFIDRVYTGNKEYNKDFNTYIEKYGLSRHSPDGDITLDVGGPYDEYPYMDTLMYYTPDTGILNASYGELELQDTSGQDSTGVYSEILGTRIPEDEAMYVSHLEDWVPNDKAEESWKRDGTWVYVDGPGVYEITKGFNKGWHGVNTDEEIEIIEDYNNDKIPHDEAYYLEAGSNEGYYAHEDEVIMDFDDRAIMREEAVTATMGSLKGQVVLDVDAYVFTSGPNKGGIFHEQDESSMEGQGEYDYVQRVIDTDDYVLDESKKFSLSEMYKNIKNE